MKLKTKIVLNILKGIILILFGALCLTKPIETITILSCYFGIALLARALYLFYLGINEKERRTWLIFNAILDVVFGLVLLVHPKISFEIIPIILGFWTLMTGLLESAIAAIRDFRKSWPQFLFGNIVFILGWIVLLHPYMSSIAFVDLFGGLLIFMGLGYIILSIILNRLFNKKDAEK